jgi:hypothetical protein
MKTLAKRLVSVLVAVALVTFVAGVAQAQPGHGHHPGPGHHPGHPGGYHPGYHPVPWYRPVVVVRPAPYIVEPALNPAPLASIQLLNPAANGVTLSYKLNGGVVRSLPAGCSVEIHRVSVIRFDRGAGAGFASYSLTDGAYKFQATASGCWDLVRVSEADASSVADADLPANPVASR